MAYGQPPLTPRNCLQHSRFTKQDGWYLRYLYLSSTERIAVSGWNTNTRRTCLDVYSVGESDSCNKPSIIYSKEFEKYSSEGKTYWGRLVSFIDTNNDCVVTCVGDKLEVLHISKDDVLLSSKLEKVANCMSVRENEIFVGFCQSHVITVLNAVDLKEIKSIILQEMQHGFWPWDMTAISGIIFICEGIDCENSNHRALIFDENSRTVLSEFQKPEDIFSSDWYVPPPVTEKQWYVNTVTASVKLGVVAVLWYDMYYLFLNMKVNIVFYSMRDENSCSFLNRDVEYGITRIRLSDRGDKMLTGNELTGEVKIYDTSDLFAYDHLKPYLVSQLQKGDCLRLINYFAVPKIQSDVIMKSKIPMKSLFFVLEEKDIIGPSKVDRLIEAFDELNFKSPCLNVTKIYQKTRSTPSFYEEFLVSLSTFLPINLPEELYSYFSISDEEKANIKSSQNPRLSLLLALDEFGVINPAEVNILQQPFTEFKLMQAVSKVKEYQSEVESIREWPIYNNMSLTKKEKKRRFIEALRRRITSWYETTSPIPWKKSCKWKTTNLFVGCSLIVNDYKTGRNPARKHRKLHFEEVFSDAQLKSEVRIILKADPGCGKTVLSCKLAYEWSQGKINDIDIFILLPLRFVQNKTLVEATRDFYIPFNQILSLADIEDFIVDGENKCCFLLDGLEEYNCTNALETSEVMQVMTKAKYPSCKVITTSRSDYIQGLLSCPMLQIAEFSEKEKDTYFKKLFSEASWKRLEVKKIMEDTSFMQEFSSVPLLFVLGLDNVESILSLQGDDFDKVSPFMEHIFASLVPHLKMVMKRKPPNPEMALNTRSDPLQAIYVESHDYNMDSLGPLTLEKLAFKGLRKKEQQLSWKLSFFEKYVEQSKIWINTGILVVDESTTGLTDTVTSQGKLTEENTVTPTFPDVEGKIGSFQKIDKLFQDTESNTDSLHITMPNVDSSRKETKQTSRTSSVSAVPLKVRFAHKVFQEWFAARQVAALIQEYLNESLKTLEDGNLLDRVEAILRQIDPADVHHILRFTCYLCPPSCYLVINHLLRTYMNTFGTKPEHLIDCICLCLIEHDGSDDGRLKLSISEVCQEVITLRADNGRFLKKSKLALLRFAMNNNISIRKVLLINVVISVSECSLIFDSGLTLGVLHRLEAIEISRCDQTLSNEDYISLLKYIGKCSEVREASLIFPTEPPVLDEKSWNNMKRENLRVQWIGSKAFYILDHATGKWMPFGREPATDEEDNTRSGSSTKHLQAMKLEAEGMIHKEGGQLEVPNSGVKLFVPPNAFEDDIDQVSLQMKIIAPKTSDQPTSSFTSNASTVVQLLPNNLKLKQTVVLSLPHCLELEVDRGDGTYTAQIFVSHHEEGTNPVWEEQPNLLYYLDDTKCIIWLDHLCSVKFQINDAIVKGKKIQVYASGKKLALGDKKVELEVGYYPDLPGETLLANENQALLLNKPFVFLREEQKPLTLTIEKVVPRSWKPLNQLQEIPFHCIAIAERHPCSFVFEKEKKGPSLPTFAFWISQGDRGFRLSVHPQVKGASN